MKIFKKLWAMLWLWWNYVKLMPQLLIGAWKIGKLPQPVITIFGGHNLQRESKYAQWAAELSRRLVAQEIAILTGGGSGIMEAASCAAYFQNKEAVHAMGIGVRGLTEEEPLNQECVQDYVMTDYFPIRKYLLIQYSYAFVIFPGAFGTLNELSEVMTLMHTNYISVSPVILVGEEYWKSLFQWVEKAKQEGLMHGEHPEYIFVTDDIDKTVAILVEHCKRCMEK